MTSHSLALNAMACLSAFAHSTRNVSPSFCVLYKVYFVLKNSIQMLFLV